MEYFSAWNQKINDNSDQAAYSRFVDRYYELETEAYRRILESYPEGSEWSGEAQSLQERLGFDGDMVIFTGFLDGIRESLKQPIPLEEMDDGTWIRLDIDFEQLLYNMHRAGARWLFGLEAWNRVFDEEKREEIGKRYRRERIARRDEMRVGRNEPCPCGSGKKYKNCHGRPGADPEGEEGS
ncbi:MAG: SEC-C metal-binding domain-containing protein [Bacillota bacterium]|nr:SEC-C metal-binding domain-containing protein [Bacillota bacterium]